MAESGVLFALFTLIWVAFGVGSSGATGSTSPEPGV